MEFILGGKMKPEKPASKTQGLWMVYDQNDSDDSAILLFGLFLVQVVVSNIS